MKIFYLLFLSGLFALTVFSQASTSVSENPKSKLLVPWAEKDCKNCTYIMVDGQQFRTINDENVYLAFHAGTSGDYFIGDVYIMNKSQNPFTFNPQTDASMGMWNASKRTFVKTERAQTLQPIPAENLVLNKARPDFWTTALRLFGKQFPAKTTSVNLDEISAAPVLRPATLSQNNVLYGTVYFPKKNFEAIAFSLSINNRIYSFAYRNTELYK